VSSHPPAIPTCATASFGAGKVASDMAPGARGWGRLIVAIATMALLATTIGTTRAAAAVYWGSGRDGVGAANLDGTNPQWNYFYAPLIAQGPACGVAVNSEFLYWAAPGGIARRRLEGEGFYPATVVPHLDGPCGLALDGSHLYWGNLGGHPPLSSRVGSIGRANLDGSEATSTFITGLERPCDITVAGDHIFWVEHGRTNPEWGGIGRASLDGSGPQRPFVPFPAPNSSCGLTASGGYIYWGEGGGIARANLDGGEVNRSFIPNTGYVEGIAIQAGHIYWAAAWPNAGSSVGRANLDGSEANPAWIPISEQELGGVAVDERPAPPYLVLPSRPLDLVPNLEYNLRSGAVQLGVYVPPQGPVPFPSPPQGELTVTSPGLAWKVLGSTVAHAAHGGYYLWQVRIRSGRGPVGRRIRAQLRRRGWARVTVRLSYTQERVYPVEASRKMILRRYRGAPAGWVKHPGPP
jgi:hypothetical protein